MHRKRSFRFKNITIHCDERCPLYYCNNPCKVEKHIEKYSQVMNEEGSYTIL